MYYYKQKRSVLSLQIPYTDDPGKIFSFKLKGYLDDEDCIFGSADRILAVSDIGGDFYGLQKLLVMNGVIDRNHSWTFDDGHLVVVGDCSDGTMPAIECLWLIYSLEERARKAGGHVHFILGNNEIAIMGGDWQQAHPNYAKVTGNNSQPAILYDGNNELGKWLRTKNIIEKIGKLLFVHGGISPVINQYPQSINEINKRAKEHYLNVERKLSDQLASTIFNSKDSPLRYRGYYDGTADEDLIDATRVKFDVDTIITGHTSMKEVSLYFKNKVVNLNSPHRAGRLEALFIDGNTYYRIFSSGPKQILMEK